MTKLRKQRRKKIYRHNVNRKRLRNKISSTGNIGCKEIKDAWEQGKSVATNLRGMGLSYDPNKTVRISISKKTLLLSSQNERNEEVMKEYTEGKSFVAGLLERDAKAPRERKFRLPNNQIEWITYLIKKYKKDYKAMAKDNRNYNQETWKQIRQKIKRFKNIPEQYNKHFEQNRFDTDSENDTISDDDL